MNIEDLIRMAASAQHQSRLAGNLPPPPPSPYEQGSYGAPDNPVNQDLYQQANQPEPDIQALLAQADQQYSRRPGFFQTALSGAASGINQMPWSQPQGFNDAFLQSLAHTMAGNYANQQAGQNAVNKEHRDAARTLALKRWEDVRTQKAQARSGLIANADAAGKQVQTDKQRTADQARQDAYRASIAAGIESRFQRGQDAIKARANQTGAEDTSYMQDGLKTTDSGTPYFDASGYTGKDLHQARVFAHMNGALVADAGTVGRLTAASEMRTNLSNMMQTINSESPKDWRGRPLTGAKLASARAFQTNDQVAAFQTFSLVAPRLATALFGGQGSGFRLTQAEINTVQKNLPLITDVRSVAALKTKIINDLFDAKERAFAGKFYGRSAQSDANAPASGEPVETWGRDAKGNPVLIK